MRRCGLTPQRLGVSIVEVLTVVSILLFLLAMLLPGLYEAKEHARRAQCLNNLRQWGVALQMYRDDHYDYLPTEGTYLAPKKPYTWFNVLPPYLSAPAYKDVEGVGKLIRDFPELHIWICPSKNLGRLYKSETGKNQFHYGMNEVLDGMNSALTPDFWDGYFYVEDPAGPQDESDSEREERASLPISGKVYSAHPFTVYLFDIHRNDSRGKQRDVATSFHRGVGNLLYVSGGVGTFKAADFVEDGDYDRAIPVWNHPWLYWGYPRNKK
ncbi:MAG: DUF1559 domain-containing protein [Planctomycetota bacterium]